MRFGFGNCQKGIAHALVKCIITATDAVALAAVESGEVSARRIALRNDADVVSIVDWSGTVEVVVSVDGVLGRARASNIDLP